MSASDLRAAVEAYSCPINSYRRSSIGSSRKDQNDVTLALLEQHNARLREHRHVRYMWFPHTDCVVSVASNPTALPHTQSKGRGSGTSSAGDVGPKGDTSAMLQLLQQEGGTTATGGSGRDRAQEYSFAQLRGKLLDAQTQGEDGRTASRALDSRYVARVNRAEAEYWRSLNATERIALSNDVLGFDCGGQQCVLEVCFPIGKLSEASTRVAATPTDAHAQAQAQAQAHGGDRDRGLYRDLQFVHRLLRRIEALDVPAPAPIEQRWTAASPSPLSPAYSTDPDDVFCWVGVIFYLPAHCGGEGDDLAKARMLTRFQEYVEQAVEPLMVEFGAVPHWAKVETPTQQRLQRMYHQCLESETAGHQDASCEGQSVTEMCRLQLAGWYTDLFSQQSAEYGNEGGPPTLYAQLSRRYHPHLQGTFARVRGLLDPTGVFSNEVVEELLRFPQPQPSPQQGASQDGGDRRAKERKTL